MAWKDTWDISEFQFGETIVNSHASPDNPCRRGKFVRRGHRTGKLNPGPYVELTDGQGKFWQASARDGHRLAPLVQPKP